MDKHTIVFVDDDPQILRGMRRSLRTQANKWDMHFFESGAEALAFLASQEVDVLISDMRMPSMSGSELLNRVKNEYPEVIRIALSGYSDAQMTLESVGAIHQYISKPTDPDQINSVVTRTLNLHETLSDKSVRDEIASMSGIPALPASYHQLMALIAHEDFAIDEVGEIVEQDMALSASILKVVNSAFFSSFGHVESVRQAVSILGIQTIKNLAVSEQVFSCCRNADIDLQQISRLNEETRKIAGLTSKFAKAAGMTKASADHSQIAGFLCYLGDLVCQSVLRDHEIVRSGNLSPQIVSGHILTLWGLPDAIVEAVVYYQNPAVPADGVILPVHAVHAAWTMLAEGTSDPHETTDGQPQTDPLQVQDTLTEKRNRLSQLVGDELANLWMDIFSETREEGAH